MHGPFLNCVSSSMHSSSQEETKESPTVSKQAGRTHHNHEDSTSSTARVEPQPQIQTNTITQTQEQLNQMQMQNMMQQQLEEQVQIAKDKKLAIEALAREQALARSKEQATSSIAQIQEATQTLTQKQAEERARELQSQQQSKKQSPFRKPRVPPTEVQSEQSSILQHVLKGHSPVQKAQIPQRAEPILAASPANMASIEAVSVDSASSENQIIGTSSIWQNSHIYRCVGETRPNPRKR